MSVLKKHYEKFILGAALALLTFVLLISNFSIMQVDEEREVELKSSSNAEKLTLVESREKELNKNSFTVEQDKLLKKAKGRNSFKYANMIACIKPDCGRALYFENKICPFCKTPQGDSREEATAIAAAAKKYEDENKDGMIDAFAEKFEFLSNQSAAYLDEDGDGFTNMEEIVANLTLAEQIKMFDSGKFFVTDPQNPQSHPELVTKLRVLANNEAKSMGITLKSVSENGADKKKWEIAFNVYDSVSRKDRTQFKLLGDTLENRNGMKVVIENVTKVNKTYYNPRLGENITKVDYTVSLKAENGDLYLVKENEFLKQGGKTVEFVYLSNLSLQTCPKYKLENGQEFVLDHKVKGQVLSQEKYKVLSLGAVVRIERLADGKKFTIRNVSTEDREYLLNKARAHRASKGKK